MDNITTLGGHSGCKILLYEMDDGRTFVRKTSSGKGYNERLKTQMEKQMGFEGEIIKTPKVYESGVDKEGRFYFDMEYIQGITLAKHMMSIEIDRIRQIVRTLYDGLLENESENVDPTPFVGKIKSLKESLCNSDMEYAVQLLEEHDWSHFPRSVCHGDLTLENIIIRGDQIYVIDFLDSFYDSWLIDVGTLLQDVQSLWAYRHMQNLDINTIIRLMVFRDILMDELNARNPKYYVEAYFSLLLKLVRIVPYSDDKTKEFLSVKISELVEIIEKVNGL